HPRGQAKISHRGTALARGGRRGLGTGSGTPAESAFWGTGVRARPRSRFREAALLASIPVPSAPLSSRGLGRRPLMAETGVRIPVAVLTKPPRNRGLLPIRA